LPNPKRHNANVAGTPGVADPAAAPPEQDVTSSSLTPTGVLATVLYLRQLCTQTVLGELFQVDRKVITTAVQDIRPLLQQHGYTITPSTARFPTPADLLAFLAEDTKRPSKIKPAC
jgi:hypothetical protein